MKNYFTNLYKKFLASSKKIKFFVILSFLIYILLLVFTLTKVEYELITPGGLTHISNYVTVESEEKTGHIYTVSVYSSKKISLLQKFLAGKNFQVDLEQYDPSTSLSPSDEIKSGTVMKDVSLRNSLIVAYDEAKTNDENIKFNYEFKGIVIHTTFHYLSKDLRIGDTIVAVDDVIITKDNFSKIISEIDPDDTCKTNPTPIKLTVKRQGVSELKDITVYKTLIDDACKIGIATYPMYEINEENLSPKYFIKNSKTIGPSGGLMQTLGIYNTLVSKDITKGLILAGTGTIDVDGNVGPIGGVKQKVMSAYFAKVDVFFVPEANYKDAKEVYDKLKKPTFELVMVRSFTDALEYLQSKEGK